MSATTGTASFLRHTAGLIALIAVGLAATVHPATSKRSVSTLTPPEQVASLTPGENTAPPRDADGAHAFTDEIVKTMRVPKGGTLVAVIQKAGASRADAFAAAEALKTVYDPRSLMPGDEVTVTFEPDPATGRPDALVAIELNAGTDHTVRAERTVDDTFAAARTKKALSRNLVRRSAEIESSLYIAATKSGVPSDILAEVIRIFSYDVDFQRDIQPGDSFDVVYQRFVDEDGAFVRAGEILYAAITLSGERRAVYRYRPQGGQADFFDENGQSVRKALLRTPLDAVRITSRYGSRNHPILGYTRMHRGVDFGASSGTPIYAAGAGTVVSRGANGPYGNYVRVRHTSQYDTAYAHMSRFAKGLQPGGRVKQGQVIGYVGSTGLATGPHLHYEVLVRGQQVNPLGVKMAAGTSLAGKELKSFAAARVELDRRIAGMTTTTTAGRTR
jgi:murein DD-endopeptidase MepM/ murein hydrolase activator NlpD